MKIYDFICKYCDHKFERIVDDEHEVVQCPKCNDTNVKINPSFGGYKIKGDNSASITPKSAASFKRPKQR